MEPGLIVTVVVVLATGFPLAFAWSRRAVFSLMVAPMVAALAATLAVLLMIILGGALLPWFLVVVVGELVAAVFVWRRRWTPPVHSGWLDVACLVVPLLVPMVSFAVNIGAWDSHSIYWTHAAYFSHGAAATRAAIGSDAYVFSHPDYPPLPSAPVAVLWSILPGSSFHVALLVDDLLTFAGVAVLAYAVRVAAAPAGVVVAHVAGIAVGLATWSTEPGIVLNGYSDAMWSTTLVAAAVLLLVAEGGGWFALVPLIFAALTKNEGTMAALVVVVLATARHLARHGGWRAGWRQWRAIWPVWLTVAPIVIWSLTARVLGARSDLASSPLLSPTPEHGKVWLDRLPLIATSLWHAGGPRAIGVSLIVVGLGWIFLRRARRQLGFGSEPWLLLAAAAYLVEVIFVYMTTPNSVQWQLSTSATRVMLALTLIACSSAALWGAVAVTVVRGRFGWLGRFGWFRRLGWPRRGARGPVASDSAASSGPGAL